jgi:PAS domain S-box-containing protein
VSGSDRNHGGTAHASPGGMGSLEDMFLNAPIGIYTSTADGRFLSVNPALVRAMGYDSAESLLESITDIATQVYCDPADREFFLSRMLADGELHNHECLVRRRDGSTIWVSMSVRAVRGPDGVVQCFQGFVIDIDAKKRAEEELRLKSLVLDQIKDHVAITDLNGVITYVNQAQAEALGMSKADIIGRFTEVFGEDSSKGGRHKEMYEETLREGEWRGEIVNKTKGGKELVVDCRTQIIRNEGGGPLALFGIAQDITQRKHAEEALRRSESRYRRLIRNMPDIVYIFSDLRGGVFWSPSVECILGYSLEELYANPFLWQDAIHPEDRERITQTIIESSKGRGFDVEYRIRDARGHWRWLHDRSTARHTRSGETFVEGLATDITDRIVAEQAIREKNEQLQVLLAEKDLFFSIIAHDLMSPLAGIHGFTKLLLDEDQAGDWNAIRPVLRAMGQSVRNVLQLLENLLYWSQTLQGLKQCEAGACDLEKVVGENLELARHVALQKNITLHSQVPPGLQLAADASMLDTIVRNLLFNAVKYTKPQGMVTVCAEQREDDIILSVRDTGIGMDPKTLGSLFALGQNKSRPGTDGEPEPGSG